MLTKLGISTAPGAMIGAAADDRAGHRAEAGGGELLLAPAGELRRHLVPPVRAAGTAGDRFHRVEAEREQHGFLEPLVDGPFAVAASRQSALRRCRARQSPHRRPGGPRPWSPVRSNPARPTRARSPAAGHSSFVVPQDAFEPFADVGRPESRSALRHSRGCRARSRCRPTPWSSRAASPARGSATMSSASSACFGSMPNRSHSKA